MVMVWLVSPAAKLTVPESAPEKSAALAWPAPPMPVTFQSAVASPSAFVRVTVKLNAVVPASPSSRSAVAAAIDSVSCATTVAEVTTMSSMPTHSSLPAALVVMMRTCTWAWLSAAAGRVTVTGVTSVACEGPLVASAM